MLTHTDLKPGVQFIYEGQPWEVLEARHDENGAKKASYPEQNKKFN